MSKVPVSLLQELAAKEKKSYPKYTYFNISGGFKCRVECFGSEAEADGVNKKAAKHEAASNLLKMLNLDESRLIEKGNLKDQGNNYVGILEEYCTRNKLNRPIYEIVDEIVSGPDRKFIVRCTLGSLSAEGTGKNKQSAKQNAAMCICNKLNIYNDFESFENKYSEGIILSTTASKEVAPVSPYEDFALSVWNKLKNSNNRVSVKKEPFEEHIPSPNNKELTPILPYNESCEDYVPKSVSSNNQRQKMSDEVESKDDICQEVEMCDLHLANFNNSLLELAISDQSNNSHHLDSDDE